jgi:hypothetical protein
MGNQLPVLYPLSPSQIDELIRDLRLVLKDNARVFYAIDPHELNDFCFPVDPNSSQEIDIKALADDQAALFEVFYKQHPLLLTEYSNEIRRNLTYFEKTADDLRDKSEMVDRLIEEGELVWKDTPQETEQAQAEFLRENFNVLLAIAMGIHSLGVKRFRDIYHSRLIKAPFLEGLSSRDSPTAERIVNSYHRTKHWPLILKQLSRPLWDIAEGQEEGSLRSREVDASAIDRIIYLNSAFEEAYKANELDGRYLFVYLSSVKRTTRVFTRQTAYTFLPTIDGQPYNFWRTRAQIFAYVVHKSREGDHNESISNLQRVRDVLDEVNKFQRLFSPEDCQDCILNIGSFLETDSHQSSCHWADFCRKVKALDDEIQKARAEVQNLGLINTLSDYETLRSAKPQSKSQKEYLQYFKEAFNSPLTRNARMKMERLQRWILVKSEFTNSFTEALGVGKSGFDHSALRAGDLVTGWGQYLPSKPKLTSAKYTQILRSILTFYRDPTKFGCIEDAYKRYVEFDTETRNINLEHELLRCFLYLALPRTVSMSPDQAVSASGDQRAYSHAEEVMKGTQLLDRKEWDESPTLIKQEYRYVQCWAARRTEKFSEAVELAKQGTEHDPLDPRFFHGLCLSIYSWLKKRPEETTPTLDEAILAARTAIQLYVKTARNDDNDEVIAANYNNLAYFLAWRVEMYQVESPDLREVFKLKTQESLDGARDALDHLKDLIHKEDWEDTRHPEFFHTEAYLEYQEFTVAFSEGELDTAESKLNNAKREIDLSIRLFPEGPALDEYRALRERIERGLELLHKIRKN